MVKKLAHKQTKELLTEAQIKELKLNKGEFTSTWNGRLQILNLEKSEIAKRIKVNKEGEFAIKVR